MIKCFEKEVKGIVCILECYRDSPSKVKKERGENEMKYVKDIRVAL